MVAANVNGNHATAYAPRRHAAYAQPNAQRSRRQTDHLFVDLSFVIHRTMRSSSEAEDRLTAAVLGRIDRLLASQDLRPLRSLSMAIDGPAALAKLALQQKRRQKLLASPGTSQMLNTPGRVHRLSLTPGSAYYRRLEDTLEQCFGMQSRDAQAGHEYREYWLSRSSEAGEGESKMLKRLLALQRDETDAAGNAGHAMVTEGRRPALPRFTIVSGDADAAIQLLTAAPMADCVQCTGLDSVVFSLDKMRQEVQRHLPGADVGRVMQDVALLTLMSGNDNLPSLPHRPLASLFAAYLALHQAQAPEGVLSPQAMQRLPGMGGRRGYLVHLTRQGMTVNLLAVSHLLHDRRSDRSACQRTTNLASIDQSNAMGQVQAYFEAVRWNMGMYFSGECLDYEYVYQPQGPLRWQAMCVGVQAWMEQLGSVEWRSDWPKALGNAVTAQEASERMLTHAPRADESAVTRR
ncbi:hypothetical protein BC831DRAFT_466578 [Entophlyctis helioformis]|nr:hypothetical protein BC831DRAFT_466578 [Entophlyctis helioformis]